jgi:hypothetical protein
MCNFKQFSGSAASGPPPLKRREGGERQGREREGKEIKRWEGRGEEGRRGRRREREGREVKGRGWEGGDREKLTSHQKILDPLLGNEFLN